jgi:hypothetical protein
MREDGASGFTLWEELGFAIKLGHKVGHGENYKEKFPDLGLGS